MSKEIRSFQDLEVYQLSIELAKSIYSVIADFPKSEKFALTDQLIRAVNSIGANIAEGFGRYHTKDFVRFLYNSRGSLAETHHHLIMAKELKYLRDKEFVNLEKEIKTLSVKLNNLITSLMRKSR